jgi:hypothetical protein
MAVPHPGLWEKSAASIGSNGSTSSGDFLGNRGDIYRLCDARSDDDGNRAALLSDLCEYPPERSPCLIGSFNVEAAKYEATSGWRWWPATLRRVREHDGRLAAWCGEIAAANRLMTFRGAAKGTRRKLAIQINDRDWWIGRWNRSILEYNAWVLVNFSGGRWAYPSPPYDWDHHDWIMVTTTTIIIIIIITITITMMKTTQGELTRADALVDMRVADLQTPTATLPWRAKRLDAYLSSVKAAEVSTGAMGPQCNLRHELSSEPTKNLVSPYSWWKAF